MDIRSAELTKYAANAMLATKISFMNELAAVAGACRRGHREGPHRHRLGSTHRLQLIYPGVGYGGSCFPKDVKALIIQPPVWGTTPNCCAPWKPSTNGRNTY